MDVGTNIALKCKTLGGIRVQALDAGITQCDCFRYTCAYKFTACVKSTQNGRLPCARKYGNAIAIFETKRLYEKRQI